MRFTKRCQYGIKAMVHLARHPKGAYAQSREIAEAERLPSKFLESILLALRSAELLDSKVGAGGGYRLARDPGSIRIDEVIGVLGNATNADDSVDLANATHRSPGGVSLAILHARMDQAFERAVGSLTVAELVERCESEFTAGAPSRG